MFSWFTIRKPKVTTSGGASAPGVQTRRATRPPLAAGPPALRIDTATLQPHPILALLPLGALDRLVADSAIAEYPKGTVIFREAEPCDAIFLIISGRCEIGRASCRERVSPRV